MKIVSFMCGFLLCLPLLAETIPTHVFSSIGAEEKSGFGLKWTDYTLHFDDWFVQSRKNFDDRGWMAFPIPDDTQEVASATLRISLTGFVEGSISNPEIEITFYDSEFYGYQQSDWNPIRDSLSDRWRDFGKGAYYGGLTIDSEWARDIWGDWIVDDEFEINLSPLAIRDINSSKGRGWAIGSSSEGIGSIRIDGHPLLRTVSLDIIYGQPPPIGDFSFDGIVNQSDLDLVLLNWGQEFDQEELDAVLLTWGQGSSFLSVASVPEPSTYICVVIFVFSCYIWALISLPKGTIVNVRLPLFRSKA